MKLYDLTPSQENIYMLVTFSLHKQICQLPSSFSINEDIDFNKLEEALNIEFQRNDAFRVRFTKEKRKIKQYFLDEYKVSNISVYNFSNEEEKEEFFLERAKKTLHFLKGELFDICFFKDHKGYSGVYFNCSHLVIDAMGIQIFYLDLLNIYRALVGKSEMPKPLYSFEEYINTDLGRYKDEKILSSGEAFYKNYFGEYGEPYYASVAGPALLEKERKRKRNPNLMSTTGAYSPLNDKGDYLKFTLSEEESKKILNYCEKNNVSPEILFLMGARTHISKINNRNPYSFLNLMCNKRTNFKEKYMGGCLAQTLQIITNLDENKTFREGIQEMTRVRTELFRNIYYPYPYARNLLRKMYNLKATQGQASFMLSWIPLTDLEIDFEYTSYYRKRTFNPLYILTSTDTNNNIFIQYTYRTKIMTKEDVCSLHTNMFKIISKAIDNPDITLKELMDL
ncbi:MAG: hypothetical protein IJI22_04975 [Bacilli bacterium]|nr:hypothetical protein [Bacilli bacterium]